MGCGAGGAVPGRSEPRNEGIVKYKMGSRAEGTRPGSGGAG